MAYWRQSESNLLILISSVFCIGNGILWQRLYKMGGSLPETHTLSFCESNEKVKTHSFFNQGRSYCPLGKEIAFKTWDLTLVDAG
jgi:hypothetical protein